MKILKLFGWALVLLVAVFFATGLLMPTYEYDNEVAINASQKKCWTFFHDVSKMGLWNEGFESFKLIKGDSTAPGSEYELVITQQKRMVMYETIKEFVPPSKFSFQLDNEVLRSDTEFFFTSSGSSTVITAHYKIVGNNLWWRSIFAFFRGYFKSSTQKQLENLKSAIESDKSSV